MTTSPGAISISSPLLAAEAHLGAAAGDGHRLVDHRVIVRVGVNAVAPHIAPAVVGEGLLDQQFRVGGAGEIDAAAIENERQGGIVGNPAVVGEQVSDRGDTLGEHGFDPAAAAGSFYRRFR